MDTPELGYGDMVHRELCEIALSTRGRKTCLACPLRMFASFYVPSGSHACRIHSLKERCSLPPHSHRADGTEAWSCISKVCALQWTRDSNLCQPRRKQQRQRVGNCRGVHQCSGAHLYIQNSMGIQKGPPGTSVHDLSMWGFVLIYWQVLQGLCRSPLVSMAGKAPLASRATHMECSGCRWPLTGTQAACCTPVPI